MRHASYRLDCVYLCVERARRKSTLTLTRWRGDYAAGAHSCITTDVPNYRADLIAGLMTAGTGFPQLANLETAAPPVIT
jgi:hypothetical protein